MPDSKQNLSWYLNALVLWVVNEMTSLATKTSLKSMVDPARNSTVILSTCILLLAPWRHIFEHHIEAHSSLRSKSGFKGTAGVLVIETTLRAIGK